MTCLRIPRVQRGLAALCAGLACWAGAVAAPLEPIIITSTTKQFVVRGKPHQATLNSGNPETVYVDPALMAMACERVRETVHRELRWEERWRDTIFINIRPASGRGERARISAMPDPSRGWRYRIDMPDEVSRREFIEPLVEAVLLEYANRGARGESVDLPPWLVQGLAQHLMHGDLAALALQPNTLVVRERYRDDAGPVLRAKVQAGGTLTVDQLNWPDFDGNDQTAAEKYRTSSHLLVRELLKLKNGPECLAAMLALLPEHMNWHTAFLRAFEGHFAKMLDVEKWWSLAVVQMKSREQSLIWPAAESKARLEEVLYTPMQVRLSPEELPHVMPVSLQTLITEWSLFEQGPILRQKLQQLVVLRWRMPAEFGSLADEYRATIESYLVARSSRKLAGKNNSHKAVQTAIKEAAARLNELDARRANVASSLFAAAASEPKGQTPVP